MNERQIGETCVIVTVILVALKLFGVLNLPWWLVFIPIWLPFAALFVWLLGQLCLALFFVCGVVTYFRTKKKPPPDEPLGTPVSFPDPDPKPLSKRRYETVEV